MFKTNYRIFVCDSGRQQHIIVVLERRTRLWDELDAAVSGGRSDVGKKFQLFSHLERVQRGGSLAKGEMGEVQAIRRANYRIFIQMSNSNGPGVTHSARQQGRMSRNPRLGHVLRFRSSQGNRWRLLPCKVFLLLLVFASLRLSSSSTLNYLSGENKTRQRCPASLFKVDQNMQREQAASNFFMIEKKVHLDS